MTKKLFLTLVSAVLLVFVFVSCGSNKKESEKPDPGDTETVSDQEPTDTGDTEAVNDTEPTEIGDTETVTDTDPTEIEDNDSGNVTQDGCTIKSSFGTHSVKRDISETCVKEIAKAKDAECSWNYKNEEETAKHITYLQKLKITFGNECKDKNGEESVECPYFIPETLKLESLTGCDVYSIDPLTDCIAQCADIYFSTGDDVFHTVYIGDETGENPFIKSSDSIKEAAFISGMRINGLNFALFTWLEKGPDGKEIEKEATVKMKIVDQNSMEEDDFEAINVGECRHEEPAFSFRDRIYTDEENYPCNEYVEVTEKTDNIIRFNWFGSMHCGIDWEYGYKVEGIEENVLNVSILERDTDLGIAAGCADCCYLMPIEYTASTTEEIESLKGIEINYKGKNHTAYFEIK